MSDRGTPLRVHAGRARTAWRSTKQDLARWPFELAVNVILASPLVPRVLRSVLLRATGMRVDSYDIYPRCTFRSAKFTVGRGTMINCGCHFDNNALITIGANVSVAMGVTFVTTGHVLGAGDRRAGRLELQPITIGDGVWIGAGVTILPGVTIGSGCVIGAGSIVRADCMPNSLYAGVPARLVRASPDGTHDDEMVIAATRRQGGHQT